MPHMFRESIENCENIPIEALQSVSSISHRYITTCGNISYTILALSAQFLFQFIRTLILTLCDISKILPTDVTYSKKIKNAEESISVLHIQGIY